MATSTELLFLLELLDKIGMDIGYLWGFLHDEVQDGSLSGIFHNLDAEQVRELKTARSIVRGVVRTKQELRLELNEELIKTLLGILTDELLNEHFTLLELERIPGIVGRWKKLRRISVVRVPDEKVTGYLRQATTCYLYGLPDAAAILCRAVLQFALEEAFAMPGGMSLVLSKVDKKDYLEKLINFARNTKILSTNEMAKKADEIRRVGNDAIHKSACTERQALETIEKMSEILSHIYGRSGPRAR